MGEQTEHPELALVQSLDQKIEGLQKELDSLKSNKQNSEKLVEHLSAEIETLTSNVMTYRIRAAFAVWIGPYILLGSIIVAMKGPFKLLPLESPWMILSIVGSAIAYLLLGLAAGRVEQEAWEQCEKWRDAIISLTIGQEKKDLSDLIKFPKWGRNIQLSYIWVFFLILLSFWAVSFLAANIE